MEGMLTFCGGLRSGLQNKIEKPHVTVSLEPLVVIVVIQALG